MSHEHDSDPKDRTAEPGGGDERRHGLAGESAIRPRELAELVRNAPGKIADRLANLPLRAQAELALSLAPRERLEVLLHAPRPMRLVRTLPDLEFYLTVREVGPDDALPLVTLASSPQLTHLLDLESWRGDTFDPKRSGAWVAWLLESGEPTIRLFLRDADDELLTLLFGKWVRVHQIDYEDTADKHGHGETESGTENGFVSPDGYHRFSPVISEHAPAIRRLAEIFNQEFPERYQQVLWAAMWELPSEVEEQALRWRQSRLEEHGFPPWEDALGVYALPEGITAHPAPLEVDGPEILPAPRLPVRVLDEDHPLAPALARLGEEGRDRVLHELIAVANRLLVADGAETGDPAAHREAVCKAAGYIRIALASRNATDDRLAAGVVRGVPVIELFREGFHKTVELQAAASRLTNEAWASVHPRALELLDAPLRQVIECLLRPRPAYFDAAAENEGVAGRDFRTMEEVEETRTALRVVETLGRVFVDHLGLDVATLMAATDDDGPGPPRFSALFLTALAWNATSGELRCEPLSHEGTSQFLRTVASRRTADPEASRRALESFLERLATATDLVPGDVSALRAFGRACLTRLDEECGGLDPGAPVDPRYVSCLLIG